MISCSMTWDVVGFLAEIVYLALYPALSQTSVINPTGCWAIAEYYLSHGAMSPVEITAGSAVWYINIRNI